jgi:SAM-dependent methyltransferase
MRKLLRTIVCAFYSFITRKPTITRSQFLASIPRQGAILEIGPFTNPGLRGPTVRYFDVLNKVDLLARAQYENYLISDPNNVPEMDYVSPVGDLSIIPDQFPVIYSSHCIEHQPDLITHLQRVEALLTPSGRYFLTIPDKRFCFDASIAESDLAIVIEAHHQNQKVHSLANIIRYFALTTHNDPKRHWLKRNGSPTSVVENTRSALDSFDKAEGNYIDVHAWRFTPSSFQTIIEQLGRLNYINLRVEQVYPTPPGSNEFYAVLSL